MATAKKQYGEIHRPCYCCDIVSISEELVRMTMTKTPEFCLLLKQFLTPKECYQIVARAEEIGFEQI